MTLKSDLLGIRNVGIVRNIGGVLIEPGEIVKIDDSLKALQRNDVGELIAPSSEVERYLADWPFQFEQVLPKPVEVEKPKPSGSTYKRKVKSADKSEDE